MGLNLSVPCLGPRPVQILSAQITKHPQMKSPTSPAPHPLNPTPCSLSSPQHLLRLAQFTGSLPRHRPKMLPQISPRLALSVLLWPCDGRPGLVRSLPNVMTTYAIAPGPLIPSSLIPSPSLSHTQKDPQVRDILELIMSHLLDFRLHIENF